MNRFEQIISQIDSSISIKKEDRRVFTEDFDSIRNYLLTTMKEVDPVFKQVYGGPSLFGSFLDNLKTLEPDEFDVHFLIKLLHYEHIRLERDNARPGFVRVCLSTVLIHMKNDPNWNRVYKKFQRFVDNKGYLCRNRIQKWLKNIINKALQTFGSTVVSSNGNQYELIYLTRGTAHTIKAESSTRYISIDFVPAFQFDGRNEWLAERKFPKNVKLPLWFAVPKPTVGPKRNRRLTLSICVPQIEAELLNNKFNMKSSIRLFKSLRDKMRGFRLKSYFIKTIYLFENDVQNDNFWKQPIGFLLIHMIDVLLDYLDKKFIPFYWAPQMNLLSNVAGYEIEALKLQFEAIQCRLESYYHQPLIKLHTVNNLFATRNRPSTLKMANA